MKSDVLKAIKDWGIGKFQPKGNYLTEIPASIADFNPHNYFSFSGGKEIQSGGDLDHMTEIGNYYCALNSTVSTLLNCPVSRAFIMKIFKGTGNLYLTQMIRCYNGEIVYRYQNINNQWQAWEHLYEPMKAAAASTAGKEGLVPAPDAGKQNAYLRGDGTWVTPSITLAGTVEGIPLDQTMGKQLKDALDLQNTNINIRFGNYLEKSYIFGGRTYASRNQDQPRLAGRFISLPLQWANTDVNNYFVSVSIQGEADTILDYFTQKITGGFNVFFRYRDGHNFDEQYAVWFDYTVLINH
ncbi:MAG: hypothetical protein HFI44_15050 [Lachnospiraceae bacterium]|nr:hypothetical protein [Lachnospiraceae bacterium]